MTRFALTQILCLSVAFTLCSGLGAKTFASSSSASGGKSAGKSGPLVWLNVAYKDVKFDKSRSVYWGLTEEGLYVDQLSAFGVAKRMYKLPLPGTIIAVSKDYLAVMHKAYISTMNLTLQDGNVTTFPVPVEDGTSVILSGNMVYFFSPRTSYQFGTIFCARVNGGKVTSYTNFADWGTAAFLHPSGKLFYTTTSDSTPDSIVKFNISGNRCAVGKMNENPFSDYPCGVKLWYSVDGTRIFLVNGRTVWSSPDKTKDLTVAGCLNSECDKVTYTGYTQAADQSHTVFALQKDSVQVSSYSWPYLNAGKVYNITGIPSRDTAEYTYELERVDWTPPGQLLVLVSRMEKATKRTTTAVVYVAV